MKIYAVEYRYVVGPARGQTIVTRTESVCSTRQKAEEMVQWYVTTCGTKEDDYEIIEMEVLT